MKISIQLIKSINLPNKGPKGQQELRYYSAWFQLDAEPFNINSLCIKFLKPELIIDITVVRYFPNWYNYKFELLMLNPADSHPNPAPVPLNTYLGCVHGYSSQMIKSVLSVARTESDIWFHKVCPGNEDLSLNCLISTAVFLFSS